MINDSITYLQNIVTAVHQLAPESYFCMEVDIIPDLYGLGAFHLEVSTYDIDDQYLSFSCSSELISTIHHNVQMLLREAKELGREWEEMFLTYKKGGQVNVKYGYEKIDEDTFYETRIARTIKIESRLS